MSTVLAKGISKGKESIRRLSLAAFKFAHTHLQSSCHSTISWATGRRRATPMVCGQWLTVCKLARHQAIVKPSGTHSTIQATSVASSEAMAASLIANGGFIVHIPLQHAFVRIPNCSRQDSTNLLPSHGQNAGDCADGWHAGSNARCARTRALQDLGALALLTHIRQSAKSQLCL